MGQNVKVVLNRSGVGDLLKSRDMEQALEQIAKQHAGGWNVETMDMPTRVIAAIYSEDPDEIRAELDNHDIVGGL